MKFKNERTTPRFREQYAEYRDEFGTVAIIYDPTKDGAWIQSTVSVPIRL